MDLNLTSEELQSMYVDRDSVCSDPAGHPGQEGFEVHLTQGVTLHFEFEDDAAHMATMILQRLGKLSPTFHGV